MTDLLTVPSSGGVPFEDGDDRGRVLVFGRDTGGAYSLMEYVVAAGTGSAGVADYGAHRHAGIEETFYVRAGSLRFLIGETIVDLAAGDFVRVPAGVRHGYVNVSGAPVELLVSFIPGGFEELFVRHRTDQDPPPAGGGFMADAIAEFGSTFEAPEAARGD
ncbi:cupin domain-containing protein [Phenylobacterium sp.]|uniref:cupin domain-containing protein n=1 Tax=Phenylobacterium sp. TaxID=1871053 RepID=UPI0025CE78C7|nr:cupin domain-containing protein [Phenylobacterium sp.]